MQTCPRCKLNVRNLPCGLCGYGRRYWSAATVIVGGSFGGLLLLAALSSLF